MTALAATPAARADNPAASALYGTPVRDGRVDRTIVVESATKWINVTDGEAIRFVVKDAEASKSFAWRFDTYSSIAIELDRIAPPGMLAGRSIKVYVSRRVREGR